MIIAHNSGPDTSQRLALSATTLAGFTDRLFGQKQIFSTTVPFDINNMRHKKLDLSNFSTDRAWLRVPDSL
jgi:hypothetical protein